MSLGAEQAARLQDVKVCVETLARPRTHNSSSPGANPHRKRTLPAQPPRAAGHVEALFRVCFCFAVKGAPPVAKDSNPSPRSLAGRSLKPSLKTRAPLPLVRFSRAWVCNPGVIHTTRLTIQKMAAFFTSASLEAEVKAAMTHPA